MLGFLIFLYKYDQRALKDFESSFINHNTTKVYNKNIIKFIDRQEYLVFRLIDTFSWWRSELGREFWDSLHHFCDSCATRLQFDSTEPVDLKSIPVKQRTNILINTYLNLERFLDSKRKNL